MHAWEGDAGHKARKDSLSHPKESSFSSLLGYKTINARKEQFSNRDGFAVRKIWWDRLHFHYLQSRLNQYSMYRGATFRRCWTRKWTESCTVHNGIGLTVGAKDGLLRLSHTRPFLVFAWFSAFATIPGVYYMQFGVGDTRKLTIYCRMKGTWWWKRRFKYRADKEHGNGTNNTYPRIPTPKPDQPSPQRVHAPAGLMRPQHPISTGLRNWDDANIFGQKKKTPWKTSQASWLPFILHSHSSRFKQMPQLGILFASWHLWKMNASAND